MAWNGSTNPFGVPPWTVTPETRRPADLVDHRALGYFYDTVDPECQPKRFLPKELKERLPKELLKDRLPKELFKDRLPKELKERFKELKERLPKELKEKELKERSPKELKDIRETRHPFIRPELRPELEFNALALEPDVDPAELEALREELRARGELGRGV